MDPQFLLLSGAIVSLKIVTLLALLWAPTAAALKLLAFGDSILDTGNTLFLPPKAWQPEANWAPYGRELVPPGPTGRFSDGHLITDFIAKKMGLPPIPPFLQTNTNFDHGANFAVAGAGAALSTSFSAVSLADQVRWFQAYADAAPSGYALLYWLRTPGIPSTRSCTHHSAGVLPGLQRSNSDALALISVGSNDYLDLFRKHYPHVPERRWKAVSAKVVNETVHCIQVLYAAGVRNVVVLGIGPLGCTPVVRAVSFWTWGKCNSAANAAAESHNEGLEAALEELRMATPDASLLMLHSKHAFADAIKLTGIPETRGACCGGIGTARALLQCGKSFLFFKSQTCKPLHEEGIRYLFWDFVHPSSAATEIVSDFLWSGTSQQVHPVNLSSVINNLSKVSP